MATPPSTNDEYDATLIPSSDWLDNTEEVDDEITQIEEYELISSPNDFNISTIFNFIQSGAVKIPGFQRNYVWDIKRASKLIESIIIGLPIPQIFLYEEVRNRFLVIDGQQRLMSIYYFIKKRFPIKEKRTALRRLFAEFGHFPDDILDDDEYFSKFDLRLPKLPSGSPNRFNGLNYDTLGDYRTTFDLRTIRNVIVKQTAPREDNSSIFEIFNRLNTGGMNLSPQEIRASLYHSDFYSMLANVNTLDRWRKIVGVDNPDIHMKDIEVILRSFAMLIDGQNYASGMSVFLNRFSLNAQKYGDAEIKYLHDLFSSFVEACDNLPSIAFQNENNKKFNISVFESVFTAVATIPLHDKKLIETPIEHDRILQLKEDPDFIEASQKQTTNKSNVATRLRRAREIFQVVLD